MKKEIYVTKISIESFNALIDLGYTIVFVKGSNA